MYRLLLRYCLFFQLIQRALLLRSLRIGGMNWLLIWASVPLPRCRYPTPYIADGATASWKRLEALAYASWTLASVCRSVLELSGEATLIRKGLDEHGVETNRRHAT